MLLKSRKTMAIRETEPVFLKKAETHLCYYHQLDPWQQDNNYIRSGYVRETRSYRKCLHSLLYLHNESVNIYTHLVPTVFALIFFTSYVNAVVAPHEDHVWVKLNFVFFGVGLVTCLCLSAIFHLVKSHSHRVCRFGNQCDYFGIVVVITSSLCVLMPFIFYEDPKYKYGFMGIFVFLGTICAIITFDAKFSTPHYRPFRSTMFILFGLSGVFPVLAAIYLYGTHNAVRRSGAHWLVLEGFFYIFGACLYALRVPEKWVYDETAHEHTEGRFDIFGSLHQIFHVFVVIAAYCHWRVLFACYAHWQSRIAVTAHLNMVRL